MPSWAGRYIAHDSGGDTFNLYDVSALAHADLVRAMRGHTLRANSPVTPPRLVANLKAQLAVAAKRAAADPFHAGVVYDDFDSVPHAFGLVATARLYREASGDRRYDAFVTAQRDWVFGANAWGTSFMVGEGTNFERCPQHVVANLSGHGSRYVDDVRSWQTSEPADDFTALGLYALTLTARGADR